MQVFTFQSFDDKSTQHAKKRDQKFSQAELDAACEVARQEGRHEGMETAARQAKTEAAAREQALLEITRMLAEQSVALLNSHKEYLEQQVPALTQLATSIARKVCLHTLKDSPLPEIEGIVREAAPLLVDAPEIIITVHPSMAAPLKERVHALLQADAQKVTVKIAGDENLGAQDCQIAWKNGAITRDTTELWQQINALLEAHVGKMPAPEAEVLPTSSSSTPTPHAANK